MEIFFFILNLSSFGHQNSSTPFSKIFVDEMIY
nr:MAG TPA: hypothetical protein [Caudoviricetes sp.]